MSTILIIDDDSDFSRSLQIQLEMHDHQVSTAQTGTTGLQQATVQRPDLILLDLKLRETDGLDVLARLRASGVDSPVAIITGEQDMQANIEAVRQGVDEYLRKPFPLQAVLDLIVELERKQVPPLAGIVPLREIAAHDDELVGATSGVLDLLKQVGLLSRSRVNVLIEGESGSGKEVLGRALHVASCPKAPFVAINCTAVVPTLLESELFGHVKGAFTGADAHKVGRLAQAGEGTLLLDEIGDLPLDLQPKLLRVIQEREFTPVGGVKAQPFAARVVAVTHRNLELMVEQGRFREDLFYRLAVTRLPVPPLRERKDDLELLTLHFLWRIAHDLHRPVRGVSRDALLAIRRYEWPGNVRELRNLLTRAVALAKSDVISAADLGLQTLAVGSEVPQQEADILPLAEVERQHVFAALELCGWNITHAAERLGISRPTLRKKISDYALVPSR